MALASEGVSSIAIDITDRRKAEEALRKNEEKYRSVTANMSRCIAIYDPVNDAADFVIVEFNRAAEKLEGIAKDQVLGKSVQEVKFPQKIRGEIERFAHEAPPLVSFGALFLGLTW